MTAQFLPLLREAQAPQVITVTSGGMYTQKLRTAELVMSPVDYKPSVAYARAKRAQVALTQRWSAEVSDVSFSVMHPGWTDTPGLRDSLPRFYKSMKPILRTPQQGVDTILWLATNQTDSSGQLWFDRQMRRDHHLPGTAMSAEEIDDVWDWCLSASEAARFLR